MDSGDSKLAARLAMPLAESGDPYAEAMLGGMYSMGMGVPQDSTKGLSWLLKSAAQHNAKAQFSLGYIYHNGYGVAKDDKEAARWWKLASDQHDGESEKQLAELYSAGSGVPKDVHKADELWAQAAKHGTPKDSQLWTNQARASATNELSMFKGHPLIFSLIAGLSLLFSGQVWLLIFCIMGANLLLTYILPIGVAFLQVMMSSILSQKQMIMLMSKTTSRHMPLW